MKHKLKYIAKEYEHGWTLWLEKDNKKIQLGSAIKTEDEINNLIKGIDLEKEELSEKDMLEIALKKIERLESSNRTMKTLLRSNGYIIF